MKQRVRHDARFLSAMGDLKVIKLNVENRKGQRFVRIWNACRSKTALLRLCNKRARRRNIDRSLAIS